MEGRIVCLCWGLELLVFQVKRTDALTAEAVMCSQDELSQKGAKSQNVSVKHRVDSSAGDNLPAQH